MSPFETLVGQGAARQDGAFGPFSPPASMPAAVDRRPPSPAHRAPRPRRRLNGAFPPAQGPHQPPGESPPEPPDGAHGVQRTAPICVGSGESLARPRHPSRRSAVRSSVRVGRGSESERVRTVRPTRFGPGSATVSAVGRRSPKRHRDPDGELTARTAAGAPPRERGLTVAERPVPMVLPSYAGWGRAKATGWRVTSSPISGTIEVVDGQAPGPLRGMTARQRSGAE